MRRQRLLGIGGNLTHGKTLLLLRKQQATEVPSEGTPKVPASGCDAAVRNAAQRTMRSRSPALALGGRHLSPRLPQPVSSWVGCICGPMWRRMVEFGANAPNSAVGVQLIDLHGFIESTRPPCAFSCTISARIGPDEFSRVWIDESARATCRRLRPQGWVTTWRQGHQTPVCVRRFTGETKCDPPESRHRE